MREQVADKQKKPYRQVSRTPLFLNSRILRLNDRESMILYLCQPIGLLLQFRSPSRQGGLDMYSRLLTIARELGFPNRLRDFQGIQERCQC
jgi:hypothetical protein